MGGPALEPRAAPGPGEEAWDGVGEMESSNSPTGWVAGQVGVCLTCLGFSVALGETTPATERLGPPSISPDSLDKT